MPKDIYAFLAKRVREQRKRAGLSIEKLAEAAGIGAGFLAHIETNAKKPSVETLNRIANALHVPVADIFRHVPIQRDGDDYRLAQQFNQLLRGKTSAQKTIILATLKTLAKSIAA